tara:strand:+ start:1266 stop:2711 length:1446 start_codon:yes stop_codon:yes gene_type:complete
MDVDSYFFKTLLVLAIILILFILFKNTQLALNTTSRFYLDSSTTTTPVSKIFDCLNKNADECDMSKCTYTNNTCKNINDSPEKYVNKSAGPPAPLKKGINHVISVSKGTNTSEVIQCNVFDPSNIYQDDSYNKPHILVSGYNGKSLSILFFFKISKSSNTDRTLLSFIDKDKSVHDITIKSNNILGGNLINNTESFRIDDDKLYFLGFNLYVKESNNIVNAEMILVNETSTTPHDSYYTGEEYALTELTDLNIANIVIGGHIDPDNKISNPFNGIMQTIIPNANFKYTRTPINDLKKESGFYGKDIIISNQELVNQIDIEVPSAIDVSVKIRDNELDLYWLRPEKGSNNITSYLIVLNEIEDGNKIRKYFVHNNDGSTNCNYTIRNLKYTEYHVGVVGINNVGTGYVPEKLKRVVLKHPLKSVISSDNNPQMLSCNPDGSYVLGSRCYSQTPINSNINDIDISIINNSLTRNDPLYYNMEN